MRFSGISSITVFCILFICLVTARPGYLKNGNIEDTKLGWKTQLTSSSSGSSISFEVEMRGDCIVRFKIGDANEDRVHQNLPQIKGRTPKYEVSITNHDPFAFNIVRRSSSTAILASGQLVSSATGLKVSALVPSRNIYGFGENIQKLLKDGQNFQLKRTEGHIFYESIEEDGNAHGIVIFGDTADFQLTSDKELVYSTEGQGLEVYVLMGPSPESVVQQFTSIVGRRMEQTRNYLQNTNNLQGLLGSNLIGIPYINDLSILLRTHKELLPYIYTLLHRAYIQGNTVVRPLHHEFPFDEESKTNNKEFMLGSATLVSPVFNRKSNTMEQYLPAGQWYDFDMKSAPFQGPNKKTIYTSSKKSLHLHLREGSIIPVQDSTGKNFGLKVALPRNVPGELPKKIASEGSLFWDDGSSLDSFQKSTYYQASFIATTRTLKEGHHSGRLQFNVENNDPHSKMAGQSLDTLDIMGVRSAPGDYKHHVYIGDKEVGSVTYNSEIQVLSIRDLKLPMSEAFVLEWRTGKKPSVDMVNRIDCCPGGCSEESCLSKACNWIPEFEAPGVPWCHINNDNYGYEVESFDNGQNIYNLDWRGQSSMWGGDAQKVAAQIKRYDNVLRVKIFDSQKENYEVPFPLALPNESPDTPGVEVDESPFSISVSRSDADSPFWDTSLGGLTVAETYLQVAVRVNCVNIYGFGENEHETYSHDMNYQSWTMFTRDQPPNPTGNLYSVHPVYMCLEADGRANIVLLYSSNAIEYMMTPASGIVYRVLGGVLDFYILQGDTPEDVTQQYHNLIGTPNIPAYWALGFHLSRYGYDRIENIQAAADRTIAANIPYDVQHLDIDVLRERLDFTYDSINFPNLPEYLLELRSKGIKNVVILDPFLISNETNYEPYNRGLEQDVFIYWPEGMSPDYDIYGNDIMLGYAWPTGRVVFPDYFHPNSSEYWAQLIVDYYNRDFQFDGIWLDMNDPANFGTNFEKPWNWPEDSLPYWSLKCENDLEPVYTPITLNDPDELDAPFIQDKTLCMVGLQNQGKYNHYDVHSLYGWTQTPPTLIGMRRATGTRSLVLSRSTFPGSGTQAGKWLGDNGSIWIHMYRSIVGMLEFNLFGIPFIGADVCGYFNDSPAQLCQRWMQLGAFYPFDRNHNGRDYQEQDPGWYGQEVATSSKVVLDIRYTLLPYLYTLFYEVNARGGTVVRPLANEFPTDRIAAGTDRQFLWGPALLVSPVLEEDSFEVFAYLPAGRWYDYHTSQELWSTGSFRVIPAPLDQIPLHIRGGNVVPFQQPAVNTIESRKNPLGLLVAPDDNDVATGSLFWDDGESIDSIGSEEYLLLDFSFGLEGTTGRIDISIQHEYQPAMQGLTLDLIRAFGQPGCPTQVLVDGNPVSGLQVECDLGARSVFISNLQIDLGQRPLAGTIQWVMA